jgi:NhaA family Na+:H+ antiporter
MLKAVTATFERFAASEQGSSRLLLACTVIALVAANSSLGAAWLGFWHVEVAGLSLELWVNDALMAVFFLLIGLELERELRVGELSDFRRAILPVIAAVGGMVAPALLHYALNAGTPTERGFGIPMATDIAFALGVLALLGKRVPFALRVFVVAFAVMDDLGAIIVIALFYSSRLSLAALGGAIAVWAALFALGRVFRVMALTPYLLAGAVLWFLMLKSGVHATLAGVMLAFAIPFRNPRGGDAPSARLEHALHRPVAFFILPVFALANAGVLLGADALGEFTHPNSRGIVLGLLLGKPLGIVLFSWLAVGLGISRLPDGLQWKHLIGGGLLGGIGFTMSIFITNLAFAGHADVVNGSKLAVLTASLIAGVAGHVWLTLLCRRGAAASPARRA